MEVINYIQDNAFILIPCLYVIGMLLKATPNVKDWIIPYILLILGIVGTMFLLGPSVESVIQGILVTGCAVFTNQLIKQTVDKR